jgi:hypothetical protein
MAMTNTSLGWALVVAGIVLLAVPVRLDLLLVLLLTAAIVAGGYSWLGRGHRA